MAMLFQRRLAIPLWAIACFTLALTAPPSGTLFLMPPTTVFAIAAIGIAAIVLLMPGRIPWLRSSRAPTRVLPSKPRDTRRPAITVAAGTGARTLARVESERSRPRPRSGTHGRRRRLADIATAGVTRVVPSPGDHPDPTVASTSLTGLRARATGEAHIS